MFLFLWTPIVLKNAIKSFGFVYYLRLYSGDIPFSIKCEFNSSLQIGKTYPFM